MADRRRNFLILLLVAGLIAGSAAAIAFKKTRLGLDLKGGVQLVYEGKPTAQSKVNADSLNRAIDIMRKRVDKLGVAQPEIQLSGINEITVALPGVGNVHRAPPGAVVKAVRVNPGTVLVQALAATNGQGKVTNPSPNSWYVFNDNPVLTGADITHPQQGFDEGAGGNGQPNVNFGFTSHGRG